MVFDIDKILEERDTTVAYFAMAGPKTTFEGLSLHQQAVFAHTMNSSIAIDADIAYDVTNKLSVDELYKNHVHKTCLATPRYIVLANSTGVVYSAPIGDVGVLLLNMSKLKSITLWNDKAASDFNNMAYKYNRWSGQTTLDVPQVTVLSTGAQRIDDYLAYLDIPAGEFIAEPHRLLVDHTERLQLSCEAKALAMYKLQC